MDTTVNQELMEQNVAEVVDADVFHHGRNRKTLRTPPRSNQQSPTRKTASPAAINAESSAATAATRQPVKLHLSLEFLAIGEAIKELEKGMLDESRRTLTQSMRNEFRKLCESYLQLGEMSKAEKGVERQEKSAQTSPPLKNLVSVKRKADDKPASTPKRNKDSIRATKAGAQAIPTAKTSGGPKTTADRKENEWQKVTRKTASKKRPFKKSRPDAIVIKAAEGTSYADILRKVKSDASLKAVGDAVTKIRRAANGDLLLQLKETSSDTASFRNCISESLGAKAEVRALSQRVQIEIRHIDEVTTEEDVWDVINASLEQDGGLSDISISMRKAFGLTQVATLSLPVVTAKKMLDLGKIKIGWTVCPIREKTMLTKCFKCMEYGHIARLCKNEDRTKLCRKCGGVDHIAINCDKEPSCMFCIKNKLKETRHIAGSGRCPTLKKALDNRR